MQRLYHQLMQHNQHLRLHDVTMLMVVSIKQHALCTAPTSPCCSSWITGMYTGAQLHTKDIVASVCHRARVYHASSPSQNSVLCSVVQLGVIQLTADSVPSEQHCPTCSPSACGEASSRSKSFSCLLSRGALGRNLRFLACFDHGDGAASIQLL
jgi:hypothetical protein